KNRGNSLLVVEHDEETMRRADYIIDLGPGAGVHGGTVAAAGTLDSLMRNPASVTGQVLSETKNYPARGQRRPVTKSTPKLTLHKASENNLKNLTIAFPLNRLVLITGVSGSGKSTLIRECLLPSIKTCLSKEGGTPDCKVTGFE